MAWKWSLYICVLGIAAGVAAKEEPCEADGPVGKQIKTVMAVATKANRKCPDEEKLYNLCGVVSSHTMEDNPSEGYRYTYQKKVYEASCADYENDSDAEIKKKVNLVWSRYQNKFKCTSPHFDVPNGNIIKFAVAKKFTNFIEEAAQIWKLDLNKIDEADGRTILDYVEKEINRNKGTPTEGVLKQYYDVLRKAGAKHKREITT